MAVRHSDNRDSTFTNPVIFADYPDPDIIRVGADFYMASSSFTDAPGVPICHSCDLVNWRVIGHVYDRLPDTNPAYSMSGGTTAYRGGRWAPSLRHHRGIFYVAFNTPAEGFFLCASPVPEGPYQMTGFGGVELYDPGLFFDDDGRVFVVHGANDIYLSELTPDLKGVPGPPRLLYSTCYGNPLEGSHVSKRNGFYYICNTSRGYSGLQVVYRSRHLSGPYESRMVCADDLNYAGAGMHQGGFVELANGDTWFFMFQDRDYVGKVPVLLPVTWVADWPMVGAPTNFWKAPVTCPVPLPPGSITTTENSDEFNGPALGLMWHWNHNLDDARWSLTQRPGWLRLRSTGAIGLMEARNTLTQKVTGGGCTATVRMVVGGLQPGDIAGLGILGFPHAYLAVECAAQTRRLVMVNAGQRVGVGPDVSGEMVSLRAEAAHDGTARFSYSLDDRLYEPLGDELQMQFSVKSFLGNKFALFCFRDVSDGHGGYADFADFRYECTRGPANHFSAFEEIPAVFYDAEHGTDTQRSAEKQPHQILVNLHDGDWVRFDHIDLGASVAAFEAHVSPSTEGGQIEVRLGGPEGEKIGECIVPGSGEKNLWACPWLQQRVTINPVQGVQTVCLHFTGGAGYLMRLNTFTFTQTTPQEGAIL